jgi:hypothetical protein
MGTSQNPLTSSELPIDSRRGGSTPSLLTSQSIHFVLETLYGPSGFLFKGFMISYNRIYNVLSIVEQSLGWSAMMWVNSDVSPYYWPKCEQQTLRAEGMGISISGRTDGPALSSRIQA